VAIIDIHIHGMAGCDTKGAAPQDILRIAESIGSHGVSAFLPTIYSGSIDQMRCDISAVKTAMEIQSTEKKSSEFGVLSFGSINRKSKIAQWKSETRVEENRELRISSIEEQVQMNTAAAILGVNLEGPFLNPVYAGVLIKNSFLAPKISDFEKLVEGFGDIIKVITIAPELDGALNLIRFAADSGFIVSMGHSGALYAEAEAGFNAGARGITHIFNAMRGIHHREPGIAGFGLLNPHVYVEVIADLFHLHHKTKELVFKIKKPEKIIVVSDSIKATLADNGKSPVCDPTGTLSGGSIIITESAQNLVNLGFPESIVKKSISDNPKKYLTS